MVIFRRSLVLIQGLLLMAFIVACGATPNLDTTSSNAQTVMNTKTAKPADIQTNHEQKTYQQVIPKVTQSHNNQPSCQQVIPKATQSKNSQQSQGNNRMPPAPTNTLISTKQVNVHAQLVTVLTTFYGMTLYERASDPAPGSNCTGQCARLWPLLLSNGTVISTANIGGNLTVHKTANGQQVEYNGHPLYTYSGDTAPGQTNGQGLGNVWQTIHVVLQRQHW